VSSVEYRRTHQKPLYDDPGDDNVFFIFHSNRPTDSIWNEVSKKVKWLHFIFIIIIKEPHLSETPREKLHFYDHYCSGFSQYFDNIS
jgi:hypothetical protein